ncbi:MAG: histidine kinase [Sphingobacteriales bacterium]|nr:histidine kinase [Sphingobacteriales bacterium]MBP8192402.1 histidine kinase [Chitinophagales bacterium]
MFKRRILHLFVTLLLLVTGVYSLFSLDITQLRFDVLDIKNGLSQNSVSHIYQDSKGFIWFCTDEGLNRFDGYNFLKYDKHIDDKNSLISNFTSCITESSPGVFWIGTEKGLSIYFFETKKYLNIENPGQIKKVTKEDSVTVWVQTQYSLYKVRLVATEEDKKDYTVSIEPMNAYREIICKCDSNHFFLAGRDNHLYTYDFNTKLIIQKSTSDIWSILIPKKINGVTRDKFNNYWIATNTGLYKTDESFSMIDSFSTQRKDIAGLQDKITDITTGKIGNIYIATYQHGLVCYDINRNKFIEYQSDPYNLTSIPDNKIMSLLIDNSGTLWVGTKGSGVATCSQFKFKFKHVTQEPFKTTWLTNKYVLSFEADKNENIWIGTDGGGLYKFDTKDNIFSNWRNNSSYSSLSNDIVQDLLIDSYGNLWAGTLNGICKFNPTTNAFKRYFFTPNGPSDNLKIPAYSNIRLFETSANEIYALDEHSIYHFNISKNRFENTLIDLKSNNIIPRGILEDKDSSWWIASASGLIHLSIRNGLLNKSALIALNKKYFKTDQLYCLLPWDDDRFWIGSGNNGLFLFNRKKMTVETNLTEKNGLSNNFIYGILKDNAGKLWMSTNRGVSVFDPTLKQFRNYDINDGLQSNEFNGGAYFKMNGNELLFGGINGFNIIEPDKIPFNNYKPLVNITSIKTDDSTYNLSPYTVQKKRIRFANNQNNLAFEFASSDYANTPKNTFEYRLDGYEKNWTKTNRNYVSYAQLPPGNYTFYVRASNNDGVWSEQPASFSFRIRPMIWQTWWFRIIAGIIILYYGYRFITNRIQMARVKEKEQSLLARQKTEYEKQLAEIKLKALVAQMNPHFIFNCMNSIQAMILSDQNMQASTYLTKLSRLVRSVLENSVKTFIPLQEVIENLKLYLELESLRFDQQFNYDIRTEGLDVYSIEMPSMLIQPYVENSIWHGLLKKEGDKNIHIRFYKDFNYLICEIEDNGIGRVKATELNLKKQHKSLGTLITKEMFDTLHKIKETDYSVEIIDLYDEHHLPTGTRVMVRIELN